MNHVTVYRSVTNLALSVVLLVLTLISYAGDLFLRGKDGSLLNLFTMTFGIAAFVQMLRTFVVRIEFCGSGIKYRTLFGIWRGIEYSKVQIVSDRGESIAIYGEDILGKSISIKLYKVDGNLDQVCEFLVSKQIP